MVNKGKIGILGYFSDIYAAIAERNLRSFLKLILVALPILFINFYRIFISPVFAAFGVRCRHTPTCSAYGRDAFLRHGFWRGGWLTVSRLSRCHPWGSYGFDEVPDTLEDVGWRIWRNGDWAWTPRGGVDDKGQPS